MGRDRKGAVHDPTRSGSEPVDGLRRLRRVRATARSGKELGPTARLVALLGGEAGLRCGEIIGLEWSDVDLVKRQMCIQRSEWRGHVTAPKGGRLRYVPMTARLASAMRDHRHLKGPRVLRLEDGLPLTQDVVGEYVRKAGRESRCSGQWSASITSHVLFASNAGPAEAGHYDGNQAAWRNTGDEGAAIK